MAVFNLFKSKKIEKREANNVEKTPNVRVIGSKAFQQCVTSPAEALKSSVVYRGISILSDSVATVPLSIYHKNKQGYFVEDFNHPLYKLLNFSPSKRQNPYEFLENIIIQMIVYGNAYIYIRRDMDEVKELILLYPQTTLYDEYRDVYNVNDTYNDLHGEFQSNQIIHIRHKSLGTYTGQSIFTYAGRTIALANATDKEAITTLEKGGKLRGIISSESSLVGFSSATDAQVDTVRDNLQAQIDSGQDILTLQSGTSWSPMSQTMRDLQLVDLHNTTLSDLARYFGISPVKLGISSSGNYQAAIQDSLNFYIDTLNPLLNKIEKAFNKKLIPDTVALKYKVEFDRTSLPYYKEILNNYEKMMQIGLASVNDIRKLVNMDAAEGGDFVFITTNAQRLDAPVVKANTDNTNQAEQEAASNEGGAIAKTKKSAKK